MPAAARADADIDREFARVLAERDLRAVFQPVVALASGEVVGLEALARGPVGSVLETPHALFAAARRCGKVGELDWACRAAAFRAFAAADLPPAMSLFVNIEPDALALPCPPDLLDTIARAESLLRVVVEVNDRALAADPSGLLKTVDRARASGWGVALDDVGSSGTSLAVLPMVGADVVKLDLRLLRERDSGEASAITLSVLRLVESSSATLLVEGVETAADAAWAQSIGAKYGQGFHFAAPGSLARAYPMPRTVVPLRPPVDAGDEDCTPSAHLTHCRPATMTRDQFDGLAKMVFRVAHSPGAAPVILGGRDVRATAAPISQVDFPALDTPPLLTVMFGTGRDMVVPAGTVGVEVAPTDPLTEENFLIVLREQEAVALVGWRSDQADGLIDTVLTQDPALVHAIARHLIRRIPGDLVDDVPDEPAEAEGVPEPGRTGWRHRLHRG